MEPCSVSDLFFQIFQISMAKVSSPVASSASETSRARPDANVSLRKDALHEGLDAVRAEHLVEKGESWVSVLWGSINGVGVTDGTRVLIHIGSVVHD